MKEKLEELKDYVEQGIQYCDLEEVFFRKHIIEKIDEMLEEC